MNIKRWAIGLIGSVIVLVAIYGGAIIYFTWPITELSINNSGVFGDSFGLLTSLFSGQSRTVCAFILNDLHITQGRSDLTASFSKHSAPSVVF